ncbi:CAP family protein [Nocardia brasiliensis]|uniref:CAP family protein n=1 Tax=Nocardia brasiliensis TaxID=37326 RepID=UPI0037957398
MHRSRALTRYALGVAVSIAVAVATVGTAGPASARPAFPDHTDAAFQSDCLGKHNELRRRHGVPAMKISAKAVDWATKRAQMVSQYEGLQEGHAGNAGSGFGENLAWSGSSSSFDYNCAKAVQSWYDEIRLHNFDNNNFDYDTGHFTQVVWKNSVELGCARASGKGSRWFESYVVCSYLPAGNFQGQFVENVPRPIQ